MNATEHSKVRLAFLTCFDFDAPGATVFRAFTRGCLAQNYMQNGGHQLELRRRRIARMETVDVSHMQ